MSRRLPAGQNRAMANGDGEVSGSRSSRPDPPTPRGRMLLALAASVLATASVSVPLAYQAASARDGSSGTPATAPVTPSTVAPSSTAAPTTATPPASSTPGTVPTRVLPTQLERPGDRIVWSRSASDPASHPLEGATLNGRVVVAFEPSVDSAAVVRVGFWVDHLDDVRPPEHVDRQAPFTLTTSPSSDQGTAEGPVFDTTELTDGPHAVLVEAVGSDGRTVQRVSRFRVDNG